MLRLRLLLLEFVPADQTNLRLIIVSAIHARANYLRWISQMAVRHVNKLFKTALMNADRVIRAKPSSAMLAAVAVELVEAVAAEAVAVEAVAAEAVAVEAVAAEAVAAEAVAVSR